MVFLLVPHVIEFVNNVMVRVEMLYMKALIFPYLLK